MAAEIAALERPIGKATAAREELAKLRNDNRKLFGLEQPACRQPFPMNETVYDPISSRSVLSNESLSVAYREGPERLVAGVNIECPLPTNPDRDSKGDVEAPLPRDNSISAHATGQQETHKGEIRGTIKVASR
jgi:hypothetical protein